MESVNRRELAKQCRDWARGYSPSTNKRQAMKQLSALLMDVAQFFDDEQDAFDRFFTHSSKDE